MKIILQQQNQLILRLDKGEEVLASLAQVMAEQNIKACAFFGLGASDSVELAFYNTHLKDYRKKPFLEEMEILSLSGNGSIKDGQPAIHAHGIFGRNDFSLIGGHVIKLVVSVTLEIYLTKLEGEMKRELNADFNLNTLV